MEKLVNYSTAQWDAADLGVSTATAFLTAEEGGATSYVRGERCQTLTQAS